MKILFLANNDTTIYNQRIELVERLIKDGHEVHISSLNGDYVDKMVSMGCVYHEVFFERHGMNPLKEMGLVKQYSAILEAIKPDIIFGYTIKQNIYGSIAAGRKGISFVANITGLGPAVENGGIKQKIAIVLYKYAFRNIKKVFFQNEENRAFFVKHKIAIGKHDMLPGSGVNLERYSLLPYPDDDITEFVFIGRIVKEKGIDQYLEAAEFIKNKYPKTKFHVCGKYEEEYKGKLDEYDKNGIVIYHGIIDDVRTVLEHTHCTVLPTYYPEGMANVLLESAACGRPIITTDRSGCRETIDDGVNGFVCKQKDSNDLIAQIEKFMALNWEDKKNMGLAGRTKVEKEFDRQIVIDKYLEEIAE